MLLAGAPVKSSIEKLGLRYSIGYRHVLRHIPLETRIAIEKARMLARVRASKRCRAIKNRGPGAPMRREKTRRASLAGRRATSVPGARYEAEALLTAGSNAAAVDELRAGILPSAAEVANLTKLASQVEIMRLVRFRRAVLAEFDEIVSSPSFAAIRERAEKNRARLRALYSRGTKSRYLEERAPEPKIDEWETEGTYA